MNTVPALRERLVDVIDEYDRKLTQLPAALSAFYAAGDALKAAATISGTWGQTTIDTGRVYDRALQESLLKSAWHHVYNGLNIKRIASADDRRKFEMAMSNPPPFTLDNVVATFESYVTNPRGNILRGLAEVFCSLDQAYKSHAKVKIGVAGLPKRVILRGFGDYSSYGRDRVENILNALAAYQGKPLIEYNDLRALMENETHLRSTRGVRLKRFANGNGHLFFEPDTLRDINKALAEFYGEVLCDTTDEKPEKPAAGTAVSKDLQFYPTPHAVIERVLDDLLLNGHRVLEPSCGDGRFMEAMTLHGATVYGIEVDPGRAAICRQKGLSVVQANFLECPPTPEYDDVVMNPPFYGKHYAKHIAHAMKFLKPGGKLTAILPATARYDHGLVDGRWQDLPVGSFSESGTNINTAVLMKFKEAA